MLPATSAFGKEEGGKWPFRPYIQMLANTNVSAGKIITKMQFDINSPVPRLLFSPSSAVPPEMRETIINQSKTLAAENAVKLTVYKTDGGDDEEAQPSAQEATPEPTVRETPKTAAKAEDVTDILTKWSKK